jgi:endonuclease/exonuclease/phosphatase family metal-dependent hydrolase
LRIGCYNVCHYSSERIPTPNGTEEEALEFRNIISEINADIWGLCEHNALFNNEENTTSKDMVWKSYKYMFSGTEIGYLGNGVASVYEFKSVDMIYFENQPTSRYFLDCKYNIQGKEIHVLVAHLEWQDRDKRHAQIQQMYDYSKTFKYVIICGDMNPEVLINNDANGQPLNAYYKEEMKFWESFGFKVANAGYLGEVNTIARFEEQNEMYPWDNVIVNENIEIMKMGRVTNPRSDHFPFFADLVIY